MISAACIGRPYRALCALLAFTLVWAAANVSADMIVSLDVPATANPYLADPANVPDQTGDKFDGTVPPYMELDGTCVTLMIKSYGSVNNDPNFPVLLGPDGQNFGPTTPIYGAQGGVSSWDAPLVSLLGVFMGNVIGPAPAALPYDIEFASIAPALGQVFFIGDGMYGNGICQTVVVPNGATRFYLAVMDTNEWKNNTANFGGIGFGVDVHCMVPEPATGLLALVGMLGMALFARRARR